MRIFVSLSILALAALLGFSAGDAQAGRFFGSIKNGTDYTYPYPYPSQNSFDYGPGSYHEARRPFFRHRLFHRDKGITNEGMPANTVPGYGVLSVNGASFQYMQQAPMMQSPILTPPVHMTSVVRATVPANPAVQSRLVPIPALISSGPTTAEPPPADPTDKAPFGR